MAISREQSDTDDVLSHERNWSELPEDILHLFSKKLSGIFDFIRFRAVCKSWQFSALVNDPPPQLPWLVEHLQQSSRIIRLYCLSSDKVLTIYCPGSRHAYPKDPTYRYLLVNPLRNFNIYLLNPLTHDHLHVPFFNEIGLIGMPNYISSYPIEGSNIVVIIGYKGCNIMAFWLSGADEMVYVEGVGSTADAFYRGQYFYNDKETDITNVIDIATKKLAYQVAPPEGTNCLRGHTIMVESGGKILRLFQHYDYEGEQYHFDIYSLYFGDGGQKPCWVKITDISDQMLFLEYDHGLSLCASNFAGYKGNCIYFLKDEQYLCRYEIGDGTTEVLPCPFDSVGTWFLPSLV